MGPVKKFPKSSGSPLCPGSQRGKFPFLPPKCPIQAEILNISLIFLENFRGLGRTKIFPKSPKSPLAHTYGLKEEAMDVENFSLHCSLSFFNIRKEDIQ